MHTVISRVIFYARRDNARFEKVPGGVDTVLALRLCRVETVRDYSGIQNVRRVRAGVETVMRLCPGRGDRLKILLR